MPNLVEISDFTGALAIPRDNTTKAELFDPIRDERQFELIYKMLGVTLGQAFINDLDSNGVPQTAIYQTLYNSMIFQDDCDEIYESKGIKEMIKSYVYYYFVRELNNSPETTGVRTTKGENSDLNTSVGFIVRRYNDAIAWAKTIQEYIRQNDTDYPDYDGVELSFTSIY